MFAEAFGSTEPSDVFEDDEIVHSDDESHEEKSKINGEGLVGRVNKMLTGHSKPE
jgi:hypothetical protein